MMAMFVQGFWFGSKLVREGRISPGNVMAVFWACLTASSSLPMFIPQFIVLAKGKFSMAALLELVAPERGTSLLPTVPIAPRRIRPSKYSGGLAMDNVTFACTSRPAVPALFDVS
jgi:ATP-binding cassette subfamily B (MDR/TAP) protein 1